MASGHKEELKSGSAGPHDQEDLAATATGQGSRETGDPTSRNADAEFVKRVQQTRENENFLAEKSRTGDRVPRCIVKGNAGASRKGRHAPETRGAGAPTREATRGAYETRRTAARARRRSSATKVSTGDAEVGHDRGDARQAPRHGRREAARGAQRGEHVRDERQTRRSACASVRDQPDRKLLKMEKMRREQQNERD